MHRATGIKMSLAASIVMLALLCACSAQSETTPTFPPATIPNPYTATWSVSKEKAIEIASSYVPAKILDKAFVSTDYYMFPAYALGLDTGYWQISFESDIPFNLNDLGWTLDGRTYIGDTETFNHILIRIEPMNGVLIDRSALSPPVYYIRGGQ